MHTPTDRLIWLYTNYFTQMDREAERNTKMDRQTESYGKTDRYSMKNSPMDWLLIYGFFQYWLCTSLNLLHNYVYRFFAATLFDKKFCFFLHLFVSSPSLFVLATTLLSLLWGQDECVCVCERERERMCVCVFWCT